MVFTYKDFVFQPFPACLRLLLLGLLLSNSDEEDLCQFRTPNVQLLSRLKETTPARLVHKKAERMN